MLITILMLVILIQTFVIVRVLPPILRYVMYLREKIKDLEKHSESMMSLISDMKEELKCYVRIQFKINKNKRR